jgi:hypothetical protein
LVAGVAKQGLGHAAARAAATFELKAFGAVDDFGLAVRKFRNMDRVRMPSYVFVSDLNGVLHSI